MWKRTQTIITTVSDKRPFRNSVLNVRCGIMVPLLLYASRVTEHTGFSTLHGICSRILCGAFRVIFGVFQSTVCGSEYFAVRPWYSEMCSEFCMCSEYFEQPPPPNSHTPPRVSRTSRAAHARCLGSSAHWKCRKFSSSDLARQANSGDTVQRQKLGFLPQKSAFGRNLLLSSEARRTIDGFKPFFAV